MNTQEKIEQIQEHWDNCECGSVHRYEELNLNELFETLCSEKIQEYKDEITKKTNNYISQENPWDEKAKDRFSKGALNARNKMKEFILSLMKE